MVTVEYMRTKVIIGIICLVAIAAGAYYWFFIRSSGGNASSEVAQSVPSGKAEELKNFMHRITLKTSKGMVVFETYDKDAPKASENFVTLSEKGYYNGLIFHRVVAGFVAQGGDPLCAKISANDKGMCGTGGPGYQFADELNPDTDSAPGGYKKGVVAMANSGPNTNGSQFFIMLADVSLPHQYTIFGKVVSGQEVVDAIGRVAVGAGDRPVEAVVIESVTVEAQ